MWLEVFRAEAFSPIERGAQVLDPLAADQQVLLRQTPARRGVELVLTAG